MGGAISWLLGSRPEAANPTLGENEARQDAQRVQKEVKAAQDLAEEIRRKAEQDHEKARLRQEEAERVGPKAVKETARMEAQMEEAANAAKHNQDLAEAASKAAKLDVEKLAQEVQEERKRAERVRDEAQRAIDAVRKESEKVQRAADEQRHESEATKALALEMARTAAEETRKANKAREDAEKCLKEGIQPTVTPSAEELAAAKKRVQYREDCFHVAVAGTPGSGKPSLMNAFRGLRSRDEGAAAVGVTETTLTTNRYPDANPDNPYVWYDVRGAGTLKCRDWLYLNDQGLYVFDCIIVLFDNRFEVTDLAIFTNARRFGIPAYIVRSKADQHTRSLAKDMGYDSNNDDADRRDKFQL